MTIDAVTALTVLDPAGSPIRSASPEEPTAAPGFGQWLEQELQALNQQLVRAERGTQELAAGTATSVHEVMIRLETARLSFQLAIQVRARLLEAYQDVMRMQV